jgi:putative acetyltransferase
MTEVRPEAPGEAAAIREVTAAAFAGAEHASGTEAAIVDALRAAGALTLSLVAVADGAVVGHAGFSPVTVAGGDVGGFGLGPVSVRPDRQRAGIGSALIRDGLSRLRRRGAKGCVVLGDPGYYRRFGFAVDPGLRFDGAPAEYFMRLALAEGPLPAGTVAFHAAFDAGA